MTTPKISLLNLNFPTQPLEGNRKKQNYNQNISSFSCKSVEYLLPKS